MTKKENKRTKRTFLERIALFDFEKYYTAGIRFLCHLFMWVIFTFLLQLTLFFDSGLPLDNTFAFASRSLICNMTVFYLFFYVLVLMPFLKTDSFRQYFLYPFVWFCGWSWIIIAWYLSESILRSMLLIINAELKRVFVSVFGTSCRQKT